MTKSQLNYQIWNGHDRPLEERHESVCLGRFPEQFVCLTDLAAVVQVTSKLSHLVSKLSK